MKHFTVYVKGDKTPIKIDGTALEEEGGYTIVKNGDDVVLRFETTTLKGWVENQEGQVGRLEVVFVKPDEKKGK